MDQIGLSNWAFPSLAEYVLSTHFLHSSTPLVLQRNHFLSFVSILPPSISPNLLPAFDFFSYYVQIYFSLLIFFLPILFFCLSLFAFFSSGSFSSDAFFFLLTFYFQPVNPQTMAASQPPDRVWRFLFFRQHISCSICLYFNKLSDVPLLGNLSSASVCLTWFLTPYFFPFKINLAQIGKSFYQLIPHIFFLLFFSHLWFLTKTFVWYIIRRFRKFEWISFHWPMNKILLKKCDAVWTYGNYYCYFKHLLATFVSVYIS